jgi:hypothetical protein
VAGICLKFCFKPGRKAAETQQMLKQAFGGNSLGPTQAYDWYKRFKNGRIIFLGSKVRPVRGADNLTTIYCLDNEGSLTSHNFIGPPRAVTGIALLFLLFTGNYLFI